MKNTAFISLGSNLKKDNENSLAKRVLKVENLVYPMAINKFLEANL